MDEIQAREILGETIIQEDGLFSSYLSNTDIRWERYEAKVTLEGYFTADQLEAIAWWMRNKKEA